MEGEVRRNILVKTHLDRKAGLGKSYIAIEKTVQETAHFAHFLLTSSIHSVQVFGALHRSQLLHLLLEK